MAVYSDIKRSAPQQPGASPQMRMPAVQPKQVNRVGIQPRPTRQMPEYTQGQQTNIRRPASQSNNAVRQPARTTSDPRNIIPGKITKSADGTGFIFNGVQYNSANDAIRATRGLSPTMQTGERPGVRSLPQIPYSGGRGNTSTRISGNIQTQQGFQGQGKYANDINDMYNMQLQATKPAEQQYEKNIQNIQDLYGTQQKQLEGQIDPLQERYQVMLDELARREGMETNQQRQVTNNELARRGIISASGVGEGEMNRAISPIMERYTNLGRDTRLQQEQDIRGIQDKIEMLFPQQRKDIGDVRTQIANMLVNAGQTGIQQGIDQGRFGEQMGLQKDQFSFSKEQQQKSNSLEREKFEFQKQQQQIQNDLAKAQFEYQKAVDQRDFVAARAAQQQMNSLKSQEAAIQQRQADLQAESMRMQNEQQKTMNDFFSQLQGLTGSGNTSSSGRYSINY